MVKFEPTAEEEDDDDLEVYDDYCEDGNEDCDEDGVPRVRERVVKHDGEQGHCLMIANS